MFSEPLLLRKKHQENPAGKPSRITPSRKTQQENPQQEKPQQEN
jgi:hypothetical protein